MAALVGWGRGGNGESASNYITYYYSGLSNKSDFKDHYGDAAIEQCPGMIA